ncbi:MAG: gliding motility-associated C-terminal domain-containing protein, partial [Bacteroidota bacterium]
RPILLTGLSNNTALVNTLFWTPYLGWDQGVDSYTIYRSNDPFDLGAPIATIPGSATSYEDDVSDLLFTPGEFCYTIEATQASPFNSFSNQLCLTLEPKIWVPNAFMIGGFNDVFQPVISFADFERYQMVIYGRWGDILFTTEDIMVGWDGSFGGQQAPQGVYAYFVQIQDGAGQVYEERGTLTLLIANE